MNSVLQPGVSVRQAPFVVGLQTIIALGVLGGIVAFGCWQLLWAVVILYPVIFFFNIIRMSYWRGFDPYIWKAAGDGRKGAFVFWNVLTIFLDWLMNAIPMSIGAFVVRKLAAGSQLPPLFVWLMLCLCIYPIRLHVHKDHTFVKDFFASSLFVITLGFAIASLFSPITPLLVRAVGFGLGLVVVPVESWRQKGRMERDYSQMLDERRRGYERRRTWGSSWFPRKGVIFEPQYNQYTNADLKVFAEFQKMCTVLRVNWCGCALSMTLLAFGIVRCGQLDKSLLILLAPLAIVFGLVIGSLCCDIDRKRERDCVVLRAVLLFFSLTVLALPTLYIGGLDLPVLMAVASLFLGSWYFFGGFIVRASSKGVFDTLELLVAVVTLAAVITARVSFHCVWWEAALPVIGFASLYGHFRARFPRRDLPEIADGGEGTANVIGKPEASAEKKDRRGRKRQRQMEAFRRSQRG